jgi:hypothetical protein
MPDVDEALSDYLETYEADEMFNNYTVAIRNAFIAGYKAAGGDIAKPQPVLSIAVYDKQKNDLK